MRLTTSAIPIVEEIGFEVDQGQLLALVGESGSGKTTTGLALLGFAKAGASIHSGVVAIQGRQLSGLTEVEARRRRGAAISYVPQNPALSLNPSMRVGDQVEEAFDQHGVSGGKSRITDLFERVALPVDARFRRRFPHQLSGGQQQRVVIAMALSCDPAVIVLDEPTTALDVVTQSTILRLVRRLRDEGGTAFVYVTHDLAVVREVATHIAVMYAGRIVETGEVDDVFANPRHPYTQRLLDAIPAFQPGRRLRGIPGVAPSVSDRPPGCPFAPRCDIRIPKCVERMPAVTAVSTAHTVRCFRWSEPRRAVVSEAEEAPVDAAHPREALLSVEELSAHYRSQQSAAVNGVSLSLRAGECIGIVGESGSGKTTFARCLVGLHAPTAGTIRLDGAELARLASGRTKAQRQSIQIVFQNPDASLNPRHTVEEIIARPIRLFGGRHLRGVAGRVREMLERVRLSQQFAGRYPMELSGGERQRVSIARALASDPRVLVCDEVTSALDVSVQAVLLDLLLDLRRDLGLSMLFISHDLAAVSAIADSVAVFHHGVVSERATVARLLDGPADEYTRELLAAAPGYRLGRERRDDQETT